MTEGPIDYRTGQLKPDLAKGSNGGNYEDGTPVNPKGPLGETPVVSTSVRTRQGYYVSNTEQRIDEAPRD